MVTNKLFSTPVKYTLHDLPKYFLNNNLGSTQKYVTSLDNADAKMIPQSPNISPKIIEKIKFKPDVKSITYFVFLYSPVASRNTQIGRSAMDK